MSVGQRLQLIQAQSEHEVHTIHVMLQNETQKASYFLNSFINLLHVQL